VTGALALVGAETGVSAWGNRPTHPQLVVAWVESAMHAARMLCDVGKLQEAQWLLGIAGPPAGEHATLLRAIAERYVEHCAGASTLDPQQLARLTTWATSLRGTWGLLALCAWEHVRRGDAQTAARLVAEERSRPNAPRLATVMPRLWRWMQTAA
jgi:hypothetical protein